MRGHLEGSLEPIREVRLKGMGEEKRRAGGHRELKRGLKW